ncbi:DUF3987 domain-containing protein [Bradyrhizobium sp. NBAIM32]|uniref:DUF3987 domain-containing protein n=1 Tax=Bradyrhizobium sp. NBAIM32 TaxID=2793809 RepID=UPI001CD74F13|nr:DUF3987 domain-containing protein [Bradyrhizobium sp. NBAIM32]MCA1542261.1 DUF3987 domain-containing protein [Bradyrhizobium sp. NBAIM32]
MDITNSVTKQRSALRSAKLESVLHLAAKGFRAFPVAINEKKPPFIDGWQTHATRDPEQLSAIWELEPRLNIGCVIDGGFSIDFDPKNGGLESRRRMKEAGLLTRTYTQRSPSGGYHETYRCPPPVAELLKNAVGTIPGYPGTDIRADRKGYILGAGSTTAAGAYTVEDDAPIADASPELLAILPKDDPSKALHLEPPIEGQDSEGEKARAIDYLVRHAPDAIEGQGGDNTTIKVINRVRDFNLSEETTLELVDEFWNRTKAIPPWDYADLAKKVRSASKSRKNSVGVKAPEHELGPVESKDLRKDMSKPIPGAWDEPADLWTQEKPPGDMLEGIVPPFLHAFGKDRARSLGVNSDAVTAAAVAVAGSLIPASNRLQMFQNRSSWSVLCVLWTALVGDPGSAKSAAVKAALAFANPVNKAWSAAFAKEMADYDRAELAFSGRTSKKKKAEEPAPPDEHPADVMVKPTPPKSRSKISNDSTTEAIVTRLAETPEVAPLIQYSDELSGWLGGMDAYRAKGSKDRALWLEAKEGAAYRVDRQGRGSVEAPNLAVSIIGGIQDDLIARLAPDLETDGLLQRFALIAIRQLGLGEDNAEDPAIEAAIPRVALALAGLEEATYRFAPAAAEELWAIKAFKAREMARSDIPSGLKTWLAKTDAEFGRYALAFHLIEWAIIAEALEVPPEAMISAETARRARRYVEEFLYAHALFIHTIVLDGAGHDHEARWIAGYILTRNVQRLSAREVKRARPRSLGKNPKQLMAVMSQLEVDGWVRLASPDPASWRINPAVHDGRFEDIRRAETERREAVRGEIAVAAASRRAAEGGTA